MSLFGQMYHLEVCQMQTVERKASATENDRFSKETMREESPFMYCGVDLFGSFLVKDGWKEVKRYGALYICLSSRAIHTEVVYSL